MRGKMEGYERQGKEEILRYGRTGMSFFAVECRVISVHHFKVVNFESLLLITTQHYLFLIDYLLLLVGQKTSRS